MSALSRPFQTVLLAYKVAPLKGRREGKPHPLKSAEQLLLTLCERTVKGINIHNLQPVVQADRHKAVRFRKKLPFHVDMQDILRAIIAYFLFYCGKAV